MFEEHTILYNKYHKKGTNINGRQRADTGGQK